ncbi:MAG: methyltransferase domain-containing protein [Saprospiraceae bacterium]|nr:methyltransferase domain-containing protein [Saprospiraceae bacterium]
MNKSFDQIFKDLTESDIQPHELKYLNFHHDRYQYLMKEIRDLIDNEGHPAQQILDIGPAFQTYLLRNLFKSRVNSMGENHRFNFLRETEDHFEVDLNFTEMYQSLIIQHDIIIMCEVVEHLFTKSELVLDFILQFLKPGGYLVVQTPNAVSTFKRIRMLLGYNPYELIKGNRRGHYREYTGAELSKIFTASGLDVVKINLRNYFGYHDFHQRLYRSLNRVMPATFKDGITIIGQKRK